MPLRSNSADVMYINHVVEHVRNLLPFREEVYRVCEPGAEVQMTVPSYNVEEGRDPTHVRYVTEDTFQYFERPTTGCGPIFESNPFAMRRANRFDISPNICASVAVVISGT